MVHVYYKICLTKLCGIFALSMAIFEKCNVHAKITCFASEMYCTEDITEEKITEVQLKGKLHNLKYIKKTFRHLL